MEKNEAGRLCERPGFVHHWRCDSPRGYIDDRLYQPKKQAPIKIPPIGTMKPNMNTPITPTTKSHRGTMLGLPVDLVNEWANRAYIIFTVIAVAGAAAALIASFFMWRTSAILGQLSDEKIAAAQLSAGKANERAALLEKDAADARVEQEKLKNHGLELELQIQRMGPRRISDEQAKAISSAVKREPFKAIVRIDSSDDPEATSYAEAIGSSLLSSGLTAQPGNIIISGAPNGVTVRDRTGLVQRILSSSYIQFQESRQIDPNEGPTIVVGKKPSK